MRQHTKWSHKEICGLELKYFWIKWWVLTRTGCEQAVRTISPVSSSSWPPIFFFLFRKHKIIRSDVQTKELFYFSEFIWIYFIFAVSMLHFLNVPRTWIQRNCTREKRKKLTKYLILYSHKIYKICGECQEADAHLPKVAALTGNLCFF